MIEIGKIYRHYKGGKYVVLGIGTHTETNERMVVYSPVNDPEVIWIRPYSMWNEIVDNENNIKRFELELHG